MSERLNSSFIRLAAACAAITTAGAVHGQTVIYVDDDAPDGGDGSTWETGFNDLQFALWASQVIADSVEIRIADGVYLPSQTGRTYDTFDLTTHGSVSGFTLELRGGFRGLGGGGSPNERDLNEFHSVLSGDLNGDDLPNFENYRDNTNQIMVIGSNNSRRIIRLDGLTFRGANGFNSRNGGGLSLSSHRAIITIANCVFTENSGDRGGGAYLYAGEVAFVNTLFLNNLSSDGGGGVYLSEVDRTVVSNCTFVGNQSRDGAIGGSSLNDDAVVNCVFGPYNLGGSVASMVGVKYSLTLDWIKGEGIIFDLPRFVDPEHGNYRLRSDSRGIDSGNTLLAIRADSLDFDGFPRVIDIASVADTGVSEFSVIDMGMFEYQGCPGDFNEDGQLNSQDLLTFLNLYANGCP